MGQFVRKICSGYFLALLILLFPFSILRANNAFSNIAMTSFTSPKYNNKTKKLEYIVMGKYAQSMGAFIKITDVKVEIISKDGERVKSVITTPEAYYNSALEIVKGNKAIHYRSIAADADGIGFDCNLKTQIFHIRSNVKMLVKSTKAQQNDSDSHLAPKQVNDKQNIKTSTK